MAPVSGGGPVALSPLFASYRLDSSFDEMFDADGQARAPYRALLARLIDLPLEDMRRRQREADAAFLQQGITFTVYSDKGGTERVFPYDLLPRILTNAEWERISRGLSQRLLALNMFLLYRVKGFPWERFFAVAKWSLLAYVVTAGLIVSVAAVDVLGATLPSPP